MTWERPSSANVEPSNGTVMEVNSEGGVVSSPSLARSTSSGALDGMADLVGDAAQQPPADTGRTVGRHGDQRDRILLRLIDNQMCGSPFPYRLSNHRANLFHRLTDGVKITRRLVSVGLGHGVQIPAVKRVSEFL